jgi:hypothetical protein
MCALFVDFRAAFDKVDRVKMFECMEERRISDRLVRKIRRYSSPRAAAVLWQGTIV